MIVKLPELERFPGIGDPIDGPTLMGIGAVIHSWELVEFEHSRLFSAAMGHPEGHVIPFYGERGRIFKERFALLKVAVDHHFIARPHQELEAHFDEVSEETARFADKRNDIAHSTVFDLTSIFFLKDAVPSQPQNFYALPPAYAFGKRKSGDGALPFAYTSNQLMQLALAMGALRVEWRDLRHRMYTDLWPEERRVSSLGT
jgi:hypothetical protein